MGENLIELLKKCGAIQYGRFVLTSGAISDYYIDIKKASTKPEILEIIAKEMVDYTEAYDIIAGMELGAVPLAVALSLETGLPYVIIRKQKREHGTSKQIEGESVENKKVLIVEDVTTSGGSVIKSIDVLRQNNAIVDNVITVVDRESGASEKIKQNNANLIPLISVKDIIDK